MGFCKGLPNGYRVYHVNWVGVLTSLHVCIPPYSTYREGWYHEWVVEITILDCMLCVKKTFI